MKIKEIKGLIKWGKYGRANKVMDGWYVSIIFDGSIRLKKDVIKFFEANGLKVNKKLSGKDEIIAEEVKNDYNDKKYR